MWVWVGWICRSSSTWFDMVRHSSAGSLQVLTTSAHHKRFASLSGTLAAVFVGHDEVALLKALLGAGLWPRKVES